MYLLSYAQFMELWNTIEPKCASLQCIICNVSGPVSVEVILRVTFRILAGATYLDVSWPYSVYTSIVFYIFQDNLLLLNNVDVLRNIRLPITEDKFNVHAHKFKFLRRSQMYGIRCFGIIGDSDKKNTNWWCNLSKKYYHRKGFFALLVQAAVSAHYFFVSGKHTLSTHDSTEYQGINQFDILTGFCTPPLELVVGKDACGN